MTRTTAFFVCITLITSLSGMQQGRNLKDWVQAAQAIQVQSPAKLINSALPINDNSTVADIKATLYNR